MHSSSSSCTGNRESMDVHIEMLCFHDAQSFLQSRGSFFHARLNGIGNRLRRRSWIRMRPQRLMITGRDRTIVSQRAAARVHARTSTPAPGESCAGGDFSLSFHSMPSSSVHQV